VASRSRGSLVLAVCAALLVSVALTATAGARAPASFFGVQSWKDPVTTDFARMRAAHIGTFRSSLLWSVVEVRRGVRNWGPYDQVFADAARARIRILPAILSSPTFAAKRYQYPPRTRGALRAYVTFVRDAVRRYGRNGSFWRAHRELPYKPVVAWQVWNEPNYPAYWFRRPSAKQYVRLLKLSRTAIRRVDRRGKVVVAGIANTKHGVSYLRYIKALYRAHAGRYFDVMAVHPYAATPAGFLGVVKRTRALMRRYRDNRAPIWVTEIGWATGGKVSRGTRRFKTSLRGQAKRLRGTYALLLRNRRRYGIGMGIWFAWRDRAPDPGERNWWAINTGLFTRTGQPKSAWGAYAKIAGGKAGRGPLGVPESTNRVTSPPPPTAGGGSGGGSTGGGGGGGGTGGGGGGGAPPQPSCPLVIVCP
jgi:uncharacterized membrane protein YgcG